MPKAAASRKPLTIRGAPLGSTVKVNTTNRSRKNGRATSTRVKTTQEFLPIETDPPPSELPELLPRDPVSDGEDVSPTLPPTRKGPSRAVSVSFPFLIPTDSS